MYHKLVSNVELLIDTYFIVNFNRKTCLRYKHLLYFSVVVVVLWLTQEATGWICYSVDWLPAPSCPPHRVLSALNQGKLSKWCKIFESSHPSVNAVVSRFPNQKTTGRQNYRKWNIRAARGDLQHRLLQPSFCRRGNRGLNVGHTSGSS